jgi:hypothetical protein
MDKEKPNVTVERVLLNYFWEIQGLNGYFWIISGRSKVWTSLTKLAEIFLGFLQFLQANLLTELDRARFPPFQFIIFPYFKEAAINSFVPSNS